MKTCSRCGTTKAVTEFGKASANKDGLSGQCRACRTEIQRLRRATDPDYAERQRISNATSCRRRYVPQPEWQPLPVFGSRRAQTSARIQVRNASKQAEKFGAKVNSLTFDDWVGILEGQRGRCWYCNAEGTLEVEHKTPLARGGDNAASNVVGACRPCNAKKRLRTEEEFAANTCINGHSLSGDNLYVYPDGKKLACKTCRRVSFARYEAKRRKA